MKDEDHGYANHEEETDCRFSGSGPRGRCLNFLKRCSMNW